MKGYFNRVLCLSVLILICSSKLYAQPTRNFSPKFSASNEKIDQLKFGETDQPDTAFSSVYLAYGFGYPQGSRYELGYHFTSNFALGLAVGANNYWSKNTGGGSIAILSQIGMDKINNSKLRPYLFISYGGKPTLTDFKDSFFLFYGGLSYQIEEWFLLRSEIGFIIASRYISGGENIFGGDSPLITETLFLFGLNFSIEIDFAKLP
ncbi:MAG: hypothetical protein K9G44_06650 [Melioribacteraceae bacterium]|nr:hypothetical protein [Melioribacteraceae bacterium]